jgi:hypothetical protein
MKKFLLLSIFAIFVIADVFPQAIYNSGKIELTLRTYGRNPYWYGG